MSKNDRQKQTMMNKNNDKQKYTTLPDKFHLHKNIDEQK